MVIFDDTVSLAPVAVAVTIAVVVVLFLIETNIGSSLKVIPEQQLWSVPQQYDAPGYNVTREVQSEFPPTCTMRLVSTGK
jgi:ABC-type uncharacterized transport system permease subunit